MVKHVILWQLKDELTDAQKQEVKEAAKQQLEEPSIPLGNCRLLQVTAARPPLPGRSVLVINSPALGQILGQSSQAVLFKAQSIRRHRPQPPELFQVCPGDAARQNQVDVEAVVLLSALQNIYVLGIQTQAAVLPFQPTEEILEQSLGILHRCGEVGIIKGQCGE